MDFSGVEKFIDTPVKRYPSTGPFDTLRTLLRAGSSGIYVRLAFAVAAHSEQGSRGAEERGGALDGYLKRTSMENLWVLPCGAIPPNPAELLGSPPAARVMGQLKEHADVVVYDSPPAVILRLRSGLC